MQNPRYSIVVSQWEDEVQSGNNSVVAHIIVSGGLKSIKTSAL